MTHLVWKRSALALLTVAAVGLAGCGGAAKQPAPAGEAPINPNPPVAAAPVDSLRLALYFSDWQAQHPIPEERYVAKPPASSSTPTLVLKELLKGPADPHLHRALPESITLVEDVTVTDGVAYVNLSKELLELKGSTGVSMALNSIGLTLTELPGIQKVQILVDGQKQVTLDGNPLGVLEGRGLLTHPVMVDAERVAYLQDRVDKGQDLWRLDAKSVLQWEGRMFGFTAAELEAGTVTVDGNEATGVVSRADKRYTVKLVRDAAKGEKGVWSIESISE